MTACACSVAWSDCNVWMVLVVCYAHATALRNSATLTQQHHVQPSHKLKYMYTYCNRHRHSRIPAQLCAGSVPPSTAIKCIIQWLICLCSHVACCSTLTCSSLKDLSFSAYAETHLITCEPSGIQLLDTVGKLVQKATLCVSLHSQHVHI